MGWWGRRAGGPDDAGAEPHLGRGDRVLVRAVETMAGRTIVATVHELVVLAADGSEELRRRWLDVDEGGWEDLTGTISVTWVGGGRPQQWTFGPERGRRFAEAFRDRVQSSVLVTAPVDGPNGPVGRAAIRKDLRTGELVPQILWSRRARRADPEVAAAGERVLAELRERAGL